MSLISAPSVLREAYVVDSWPLLEIIKGVEISKIDTLISAANLRETRLLMSEVNLGEIFYLTSKRHSETRAETVLQYVQHLPISIAPMSSGDAISAARIKARHNISYADAFCASLAILNRAPIVTGDPDFLKLRDLGVIEVDWLGA